MDAINLKDYVSTNPPGEFSVRPIYLPEADTLTLFIKNKDSYAKRLDDLLTLYLSIDSDELTGCEVKGLRHHLELLGNFGIEIKTGKVCLGLLFLAYIAQHRERLSPDALRQMQELARMTDIEIPSTELDLV